MTGSLHLATATLDGEVNDSHCSFIDIDLFDSQFHCRANAFWLLHLFLDTNAWAVNIFITIFQVLLLETGLTCLLSWLKRSAGENILEKNRKDGTKHIQKYLAKDFMETGFSDMLNFPKDFTTNVQRQHERKPGHRVLLTYHRD